MTNEVIRPLDSLQVMAYIIKQCRDQGIEVNATKLQKLMYCCYGVALAMLNFRICDESPEAWQYGPVFPRTLKEFKDNGIQGLVDSQTTTEADQWPSAVKDSIRQTLAFFGRYTANQLSMWSHLKGSPWSRASNDGKDLYGQIDDSSIRAYFSESVVRRAPAP